MSLTRENVIKRAGYKNKAHRQSWLVEDRNKIVFLCWTQEYDFKSGTILVLDKNWKSADSGKFGFKQSTEMTDKILSSGTKKKIQVILQKRKRGTGSAFGVPAEFDGAVSMLYDVELHRKGDNVIARVMSSKRI